MIGPKFGSLCLLVSLCLLAACGGPANNSPQGVCARQAEDDPAVKQLVMLSGTNASLEMELRPRLREARRKATNSCLAAKGIFVPGGVEAPEKALVR
jgi:hypothetical protein